MAKITKHEGPSDAVTGQGDPARRQAAPSAAEMLRQRGKLGPYLPDVGEDQVQLTPGTTDKATGEATPPTPTTLPQSAEEIPVGGATEEAPEEEAPEQPARNASRADWAAYVEATFGVEVPEDAKRDELVEMYGTPPEG